MIPQQSPGALNIEMCKLAMYIVIFPCSTKEEMFIVTVVRGVLGNLVLVWVTESWQHGHMLPWAGTVA